MIDDLLMLTCGWVAGVITTLAIRQARDDEHRPLDPTLLPAPAILIPTSRGKNAPASGAPQLSPYAPKTARKPLAVVQSLLKKP